MEPQPAHDFRPIMTRPILMDFNPGDPTPPAGRWLLLLFWNKT